MWKRRSDPSPPTASCGERVSNGNGRIDVLSNHMVMYEEPFKTK